MNTLFELMLRLAQGEFRLVAIGKRNIGTAFKRKNAKRRQETDGIIMSGNDSENAVVQTIDLFFVEWHAYHKIVLAPMAREAHAVRLHIAQDVANLTEQRVALPLSIPIVENAHMAQINVYHTAPIIGMLYRIVVCVAQEVVDTRQTCDCIGTMGRRRVARCGT